MEFVVDTAHWIGRKEEGGGCHIIIQFSMRLHQDSIWKCSENSAKTWGVTSNTTIEKLTERLTRWKAEDGASQGGRTKTCTTEE